MAEVAPKFASGGRGRGIPLPLIAATPLPRYASFSVLVGVVPGWQSHGMRLQLARAAMAG